MRNLDDLAGHRAPRAEAASLRDYMKSGEADYDESHVAECEVILNNHATAMRNAGMISTSDATAR